MIQTLYRGSVKDVLGPIHLNVNEKARVGQNVLFRFSDSFSVFDWGKMPEALPQKGLALALMTSDFFQRIEDPQTWKNFSKTHEAMALRKAIATLPNSATDGPNSQGRSVSLSALFNEYGESLQEKGLRTHYIGLATDEQVVHYDEGREVQLHSMQSLSRPVRNLVVRGVVVERPVLKTILGKSVLDYSSLSDASRGMSVPHLVPLEVVFRFNCPAGSSLIERVSRDPSYYSSLALSRMSSRGAIQPGMKWDFPVLELFTKLENSGRAVSMTEALALTGLSAEMLQEILMKTAWVGGWLKSRFSQLGLELEDGKLEWAIDQDGSCFLVDALGPDEMRISKGETQLSKEFLRSFYRKTEWYRAIEQAKSQAQVQGTVDWKRLVAEPVPHLPADFQIAVSQLYCALANELTEKNWFPEAWTLSQVIEKFEKLSILN